MPDYVSIIDQQMKTALDEAANYARIAEAANHAIVTHTLDLISRTLAECAPKFEYLLTDQKEILGAKIPNFAVATMPAYVKAAAEAFSRQTSIVDNEAFRQLITATTVSVDSMMPYLSGQVAAMRQSLAFVDRVTSTVVAATADVSSTETNDIDAAQLTAALVLLGVLIIVIVTGPLQTATNAYEVIMLFIRRALELIDAAGQNPTLVGLATVAGLGAPAKVINKRVRRRK